MDEGFEEVSLDELLDQTKTCPECGAEVDPGDACPVCGHRPEE